MGSGKQALAGEVALQHPTGQRQELHGYTGGSDSIDFPYTMQFYPGKNISGI
jgi:hypothetical protein